MKSLPFAKSAFSKLFQSVFVTLSCLDIQKDPLLLNKYFYLFRDNYLGIHKYSELFNIKCGGANKPQKCVTSYATIIISYFQITANRKNHLPFVTSDKIKADLAFGKRQRLTKNTPDHITTFHEFFANDAFSKRNSRIQSKISYFPFLVLFVLRSMYLFTLTSPFV